MAPQPLVKTKQRAILTRTKVQPFTDQHQPALTRFKIGVEAVVGWCRVVGDPYLAGNVGYVCWKPSVPVPAKIESGNAGATSANRLCRFGAGIGDAFERCFTKRNTRNTRLLKNHS